jgi:hypothetical protein
VPSALLFLQVLLAVAHDLILADTAMAFGLRRFRGLPKKPWVSRLSRVDLKCMEDK